MWTTLTLLAALSAKPPSSGASLDKGVFVEREDKTFSAAFHLLAQARVEFTQSDKLTGPIFRVPVLRPSLRGTVINPQISYFAQAEVAGTPQMLDLEMTWQPSVWIGLRFGQFLTPFSREFLVPPMRLLFTEFAPSNVFFRDNRQRGAMLLGRSPGKQFDYAVALTNVNGIGALPPSPKPLEDHPQVMAHAEFTPWGSSAYTETPQLEGVGPGISIGLSGSYGHLDKVFGQSDDPDAVVKTIPITAMGVDVEAHGGRFSLQSEGYARKSEDKAGATVWSAGGYSQAAAYIIPKHLQIGLRGDVLFPAWAKNAASSRRVEALIAGYAAQNHLKLQLRYALTDAAAGSPVGPAGKSHQVVFQSQLFF